MRYPRSRSERSVYLPFTPTQPRTLRVIAIRLQTLSVRFTAEAAGDTLIGITTVLRLGLFLFSSISLGIMVPDILKT
jgi:hypothetical protein